MLVGDDPGKDVGEVGVRTGQQPGHGDDFGSVRSRSARRLTVIGRGYRPGRTTATATRTGQAASP